VILGRRGKFTKGDPGGPIEKETHLTARKGRGPRRGGKKEERSGSRRLRGGGRKRGEVGEVGLGGEKRGHTNIRLGGELS